MKSKIEANILKSRQSIPLHFVGIGGIGMSGIAELLVKEGYQVSGSDLHESDATKHLSSLGIKILIGHLAQNVLGAGVVVISSAIRMDNPEVLEAKKLRIPVVRRAEMLGELMRGKISIAVAGTHGKTTTTSFLASALQASGLDPTVIVGGKVHALGTNAKKGEGSFVVAEADESDGSFLGLPATYGIVTNIDDDHLDYYQSIEQIESAFISFVGNLPFHGLAVVCGDDPGVQRCLPRFSKPVITYGLGTENDYCAKILEKTRTGTRFQIFGKKEGLMGEVSIQVPGEHNVKNALAAACIAHKFGADPTDWAQGLADYQGVKRRFEVRWTKEDSNQTIVDDYAHHPTEIMATLSAAKQYWAQNGRILVAFQPHRYTRTLHSLPGFLTAFKEADSLFIFDVYSAGEDPLEEVTGEKLAKSISAKKRSEQEVEFVGDLENGTKQILKNFKKGDLLICMGAGSITKLPDRLIAHLPPSDLIK